LLGPVAWGREVAQQRPDAASLSEAPPNGPQTNRLIEIGKSNEHGEKLQELDQIYQHSFLGVSVEWEKLTSAFLAVSLLSLPKDLVRIASLERA